MTSKFNVFYTFYRGLLQMIRTFETARGITEEEFIELAFGKLTDMELLCLREIKVYERSGTSEPWANARRGEFSFDPQENIDASRWAMVKATALGRRTRLWAQAQDRAQVQAQKQAQEQAQARAET